MNIRNSLFALALVSSIVVAPCLAQDATFEGSTAPNSGAFWQRYLGKGYLAARNPFATNARVRSIWIELAGYSHSAFPVFPAEQFTGGLSTRVGIFLDLSVAGDPDENVTRFFLAHEWGHMMHGDPLNSNVGTTQYEAMVSNVQAERNADTYAVTFMRYQDHDIAGVLAYICSIPDGGPNDPHGSPIDRAVRIARLYSSGTSSPIKAPCEPANAWDTDQLQSAVKRMVESTLVKFSDAKRPDPDMGGYYDSTITIPNPDGLKDEKCYFPVDDNHEPTDACSFVIGTKHQGDLDDVYTRLSDAVDAATPSWTAVNQDTCISGTKCREWLQHINTQNTAYIFLKIVNPGNERRPFLTLEFTPPGS